MKHQFHGHPQALWANPPRGCTSLGEIVAEKVVALTDRARNEPRGLYDVWRLVSEGHVEIAGSWARSTRSGTSVGLTGK